MIHTPNSIDTTRQATQTKVTFSRIVLADGTLANINKDIIPAKDSTKEENTTSE